MTSEQAIILGAAGGLTVLIGLIVFIGIALGLYLACSKLSDALDARRERRRDLTECRAIDALGTTNHPTQN